MDTVRAHYIFSGCFSPPLETGLLFLRGILSHLQMTVTRTELNGGMGAGGGAGKVSFPIPRDCFPEFSDFPVLKANFRLEPVGHHVCQT